MRRPSIRSANEPEEGIVQFLVVDGEFAHLWSDSLPRLLLETLGILLLLHSLTHLHDPRRLGNDGRYVNYDVYCIESLEDMKRTIYCSEMSD